MKRRAFLGASAGLAVYGLRESFARDAVGSQATGQAGQDERPVFLRRALADMKSSGRAGIVLVVPDDAVARRELGQLLFAVVDQAPSWGELRGIAESRRVYESWVAMAQDLTAASLMICLTETAAKKLYRIREPETLVLLDPSGRECARSERPILDRQQVRALENLLRFVKGTRNENLSRFAKIVTGSLGAKQRDALGEAMRVLRELESSESEIEAATRELRVLGRKCGVVLLSVADEEPNRVVRDRLHRVFRTGSKLARRLPYGTEMTRWVDEGCGHYREARPDEKVEPVAIECGMAMPTREGRRYVRFASTNDDRRNGR